MKIHQYYHKDDIRELITDVKKILWVLGFKDWTVGVKIGEFFLSKDSAGIMMNFSECKKIMDITVHPDRMCTLTFHNIQHEMIHALIEVAKDEEELDEKINASLIKLWRKI